MDAPARKRLLEKVRKLLALAGNNPNEHEAAAALARAQQLMADHGLDDVDVAASAIGDTLASAKIAQRPPVWEHALAALIGDAFGVRPVRSSAWDRATFTSTYHWRFFGLEARAEVAAYAYDVLRRQLMKARTAYIATRLRRVKKASTKTARADVFCQGFVEGVARLVRAMAMPATEAAAIDRYIAERFGKPERLEARNRVGEMRAHHVDDYWSGHASGEDARLHHGVGGAAARPALTA